MLNKLSLIKIIIIIILAQTYAFMSQIFSLLYLFYKPSQQALLYGGTFNGKIVANREEREKKKRIPYSAVVITYVPRKCEINGKDHKRIIKLEHKQPSLHLMPVYK